MKNSADRKNELGKELLAGLAGGLLMAAVILFLASHFWYPLYDSAAFWLIALAGSQLPELLNFLKKKGMRLYAAKLIMCILSLVFAIGYSFTSAGDAASRNVILLSTGTPVLLALICLGIRFLSDRKRKEDLS